MNEKSERYYIESDRTLYITKGDLIKCTKCPSACSDSDKWRDKYDLNDGAWGCFDDAKGSYNWKELTAKEFFVKAL